MPGSGIVQFPVLNASMQSVYVVCPSVPCGAGPCRLTLELVSEAVATPQMSSLYPFNALRNHALLLVKTEVWSHTHLSHIHM